MTDFIKSLAIVISLYLICKDLKDILKFRTFYKKLEISSLQLLLKTYRNIKRA